MKHRWCLEARRWFSGFYLNDLKEQDFKKQHSGFRRLKKPPESRETVSCDNVLLFFGGLLSHRLDKYRPNMLYFFKIGFNSNALIR